MTTMIQPKTDSVNRNEAPARDAAQGLKVQTGVKAGGASLPNHNEAPARDTAQG